MSDKLKPSQLLLLGAEQVPQCRCQHFQYEAGTDRVIAACALGTMAIGKAGSLDFEACCTAAKEVVPQATRFMVAYFNDDCGWSPQQIARWLERNGL